MAFATEDILEEFGLATGPRVADVFNGSFRFIVRSGAARFAWRTAEQIREYVRAWRQANPERMREYQRRYHRRQLETNAEEYRARQAEKQRRRRQGFSEEERAAFLEKQRVARRASYYRLREDPEWMARKRSRQNELNRLRRQGVKP